MGGAVWDVEAEPRALSWGSLRPEAGFRGEGQLALASCFEPRQTALSVGQGWRQRIWVPGGTLRDTGTRGSWAASPEGGADRAEEGSQQSGGGPSWGGP